MVCNNPKWSEPGCPRCRPGEQKKLTMNPLLFLSSILLSLNVTVVIVGAAVVIVELRL
jgi:hypothetical protein